ncbi:MAG: hypothetical protein ACI915_003516 [Gammaproteobacteria bacterium]|jgi:hypothetical protein
MDRITQIVVPSAASDESPLAAEPVGMVDRKPNVRTSFPFIPPGAATSQPDTFINAQRADRAKR